MKIKWWKRDTWSFLTWLSGTMTLTLFSSSLDETWSDRLLDPLFDRDKSGGLRFVAPRPASKLFNNEGLRAQMNAWNDDTVKTPNLFNVCLVVRETWVKRLCKEKEEVNIDCFSNSWVLLFIKITPSSLQRKIFILLDLVTLRFED